MGCVCHEFLLYCFSHLCSLIVMGSSFQTTSYKFYHLSQLYNGINRQSQSMQRMQATIANQTLRLCTNARIHTPFPSTPSSIIIYIARLTYYLSLYPIWQTADIQVDDLGCWPSSVQCSRSESYYSTPHYFNTHWTFNLISLACLTTPTPLIQAHTCT